MSDITKQVTGLINEELSRVTQADLDALRGFSKTAGTSPLAALGGIGLLGAGLYAGSRYSNAKLQAELEELKKKQMQKNLLSAGLGAAAAIQLRKPVRGLIAPDPDDLAFIEDEEFDDLWKQRSRSRNV